MASLYELSNDFLQSVSYLEDLNELGEIDKDALHDTLDSLTAPIEEKVENIVKYMKSLEALADAKKVESKRLNESAASDLKKVEWFKNYMSDNLQKAGINKLQAGIFKLSFQKGREVVRVDEDRLPMEYHVQKYVPMGKKELAYFIKEEGRAIPGVSLVRNPDSLVVK